MELAQRRWVARGIQTGLVVLAVFLVGGWFLRRTPGKELRKEIGEEIAREIHKEMANARVDVVAAREAATAATAASGAAAAAAATAEGLAPGDVQILSGDGAVDVTLRGNQVLAGLSPQTVAKVRAEMEKSQTKDSGIGGSFAQMVKKTVASAIGIHASYPVAEIREIQFDNGQVVIVKTNGEKSRLFGDTKVNERPVSKSFRQEDVERLNAAVQARKKSVETTAPRR